MVKICAVVDSGAEAKRARREHDAVDCTEAQFSLKVRKDLRGAGGDPIPARGERSVTDRTDEGQSRRIVWEVCPVERLLLSVAKITKAGNRSLLGRRQGLRQEQRDRARSQASIESATCGCLTCGSRNQLTQWMCRVFRGWSDEDLRRHDCDDDGTGSPKTTVGTS